MHKCHLIYYKKRSEGKRKSQKALADKEFNNNKKLKTMNEEVSNTGAAFMEVSFKKIENQEKRIARLKKKSTTFLITRNYFHHHHVPKVT